MDVTAPAGTITLQLGELQLLVGLDEAVIVGPGPNPARTLLPPEPEAVRQHVRCDDAGRYRPLSGLRNLPTDWHARFGSLEAFSAAVDAVYPLAQRHAAMHAEGCLPVTTLQSLFERQEGRYAIAADLSPRGRERVTAMLCGVCVREPIWAGYRQVTDGAIPCPEPCSLVLSLCREAALWEDEQPASAPPDPEIPFGAFDLPGNPVREAYLRAMEAERG